MQIILIVVVVLLLIYFYYKSTEQYRELIPYSRGQGNQGYQYRSDYDRGFMPIINHRLTVYNNVKFDP